MNIGGLAVLFLICAAGVMSLVLIVGNANMSAPVDSAGATVSAKNNDTRTAVSTAAPSIIPIAGGIVLIVGVLFIGAIMIYFVAAYGQANFKSRF
jgi:hypothetical protein